MAIERGMARELQVASTVKRGANGEMLSLKPGDHIVELKPKGVFRHTNDVKNKMFTLPGDHMEMLIDTERQVFPYFEDTSR